MTDVVLILTTAPAGDAGEAIARVLVDERLAACVNVLAPMTSVYRWQGAVEQAAERQLIIKTTSGRTAAILARLRELHSYDVPECLVLNVSDGGAAYLEWVENETRDLSG
jgi:periplasmic divalent cation tolerance protein